MISDTGIRPWCADARTHRPEIPCRLNSCVRNRRVAVNGRRCDATGWCVMERYGPLWWCMERRGARTADKAAEYFWFRAFQEVLESETGYLRRGWVAPLTFSLPPNFRQPAVAPPRHASLAADLTGKHSRPLVFPDSTACLCAL